MCGITGFLDKVVELPAQEELLLRMVSILEHRGPEERGAYLDENVGLAHARLGIIGLDSGTQPISNESDRFWIVCNGEVFNYVELRGDLLKKGHRFRTDTDTEVVLHLYEDLGPDCLTRLNGQFALAIWDSREKELFLARDRVGICPLHFTFAGGSFLFASEIKALFQDPRVRRSIDLQSLAQVYTCWTTIGSRTIFQGIEELRPGHFLLIRPGQCFAFQRAFWSLPWYPPEQQWSGSQLEAQEELVHLMREAVRLRLRAEVPVGAYLSGGLDSSIITSLVAGESGTILQSFSLGFEEEAFDESGHQRRMIEFLGTEHRQVNVRNRDIQELFAKSVWHCEKPILRTSPVPLLMLSGLVRDSGFKVVLTGEGADELFGGYNIFKEAKVRSFWGRMPNSKLRPLLLERLYPYVFKNPSRSRAYLQKFFSVNGEEHLDPLSSHRQRWKNTSRCLAFLHPAVQAELGDFNPLADLETLLPQGFSEREVLPRAQWLEMEIFMSNYLLSSQGDRMSMANSVELRLPFLDHRIIDFSARLPAKWKIMGLQEKYLLKKAFQGRIPDSVIKRSKQPYRAPIGQAFFQHREPGEVVDWQGLEKSGLFHTQKVRGLLEKCRNQGKTATSEVENMALAGILSTRILQEQFVEGSSSKMASPGRVNKIVQRTG